MNQMYAEAGEDMRSYTSQMSKSTYICSQTVLLPPQLFTGFSIVFITQLDSKIQCDRCKTLLRTLLLFQGRTAEVGLMILAVIHLLAGTDSEDERKGEVCLFQVNMPPGLPTHPK